MSKFQEGDVVYILNRKHTVTRARCVDGNWMYTVSGWIFAQWGERWLTSEADWHTKQATRKAAALARLEREADRQAELLRDEPQRDDFTTTQDYEHAYIEWADKFRSCGDMPSQVRHIYDRYMLKNMWTIRS